MNLFRFRLFPPIFLFLIIGLTPIVGYHPSLGYEGYKVIWFLILTGLSVLGYAVLIIVKKTKPIKSFTTLQKLSGIFLFVLGLASLLGVNPSQSLLIGKSPYFQGFFVYVFLWLFFIMVSYYKLSFSRVSQVLSISALAVSLVALEQWIKLTIFDQSIPNYAGRVVSTFGQPNLYSGFLLLCLIPTYYLWSQKKFQFFWGGILIFELLGIVISQSRISIFLAMMLAIIWLIKKFHISSKIVITTVFFLGGLFLWISFYFSIGPFYNEVIEPWNRDANKLEVVSLEKRLYIWTAMGDLIAKRPLLGYGLDTIDQVFPTFVAPDDQFLPMHIIKYLPIDRAHNYYLDLLFFSGLAGFLPFLLLMYVILKRSRQIPSLICLWFLIYFVWIGFQIQSVVHLMLFWMMVGYIDSQKQPLTQQAIM